MPVPDHLRLARVQRPPQARRKVQRYVPRNPRHQHAAHASKLDQDARDALAALAARRAQPVDFDPKLMLRFKLSRRVADDEWRPAGLTLLDSSDRHAAVVFAARNDLERFTRRLGEYAAGPRERPPDRPAREDQDDELPALCEDFFDAIEELRPLEPADRISSRLAAVLDETPDMEHEFDVELWFHSDAGVREDWLAEVRARVDTLEGEWVDQYVGPRAAVVLARVRGTRGVALGVADLDQVSLVDAILTPALESDELAELQDIESLPDAIPSPLDEAPVVGLIDTGVRAGHPLLRPAIVDATALDPGFGGQGEDGHGHGTAVAGSCCSATSSTPSAVPTSRPRSGWPACVSLTTRAARRPGAARSPLSPRRSSTSLRSSNAVSSTCPSVTATRRTAAASPRRWPPSLTPSLAATACSSSSRPATSTLGSSCLRRRSSPTGRTTSPTLDTGSWTPPRARVRGLVSGTLTSAWTLATRSRRLRPQRPAGIMPALVHPDGGRDPRRRRSDMAVGELRRSAGQFRAATEHLDGGTSLVSVIGDVDLATAPALEQTLLGVAEDRTGEVIVDLTGCGFLDSQGLRALIATRGRLERSNRRLALVLPNPSALRIFEITQLDEPFAISPSLGNGDGQS